MDYQRHYAKLFEPLEREYGDLDPLTISAIIGFSAGGPVSLRERKAARLFVTCELSCYEEQRPSAEGLKFEFFSNGDFSEKQARALLTALGALSMQACLGHNHTVDASIIEDAEVERVSLHLFSQVMIGGAAYGIYRVRPA